MANEGRLAEAERYTRMAIDEEPQLGLAWNNLGNILAMRSDTEGALAAWRHAVSLEPGAVDPRVNVGLTLDGAGRFEEAAEAYRQALARGLGPPRRAEVEARLRALENRDTATVGDR